MTDTTTVLAAAATVTVLLLAAAAILYRRWHLRWGTTAADVGRAEQEEVRDG